MERKWKYLTIYTDQFQISGYFVLIVFKKRYSYLQNRNFFNTLNKFNFRPQFIKWIKIRYNDISSVKETMVVFQSDVE